MSFRQSVSLPMFASSIVDPERFIETLVEIGFEGVEVWGRDAAFPKWLALAAKHHITLCTMVAHRATLNLADSQPLAEQEIRASIDIAAENGIPGIICFGGNRIPEQDDATAIDLVAGAVDRLTAYAEKKQVTLLLELLNSKVDHPGYLADHTSWGVAVCRKVGSPRLRLLYDIYHMQIMEGDIIRTIQDNQEWIGHFHTAGNPGRHEIGNEQEINYAAIGAAIRGTGFGGFIGHEFKPVGDAVKGLREAFTIMSGGENLPRT